MRIEKLLLSVVALTVGLLTSHAQSNVYSANIVGYVNVSLSPGFTLVANQLDADGTGTNNTVLTSVGTNLPASTKVYAFNTNTLTYATITLNASGVWSAGVAGPLVKQALQPGGGVFIQVPDTTSTNVTFVGNVLQGTFLRPIPGGLQIISYPFPIGGGLTSNLNYPVPPPGLHDRALTWNTNSQTFTTHTWGTTSWSAGEPQLPVGGAVIIDPAQPIIWTNTFIAQ